MPVGLYNIGNTCYMNSAMQMMNTIKAIRDLVLNPGNWLINLETTDISARRIGSNQRSISVEEVIASMEFVLELGSTFKKLTSTSSSAIRPTQLLANSVLLNVSEVIRNLEKKEAETSKTPQISEAEIPAPPPLPDRPTLGRVEHVDDVRDVDMINVSVDAVSETASTRSSGTLVDQTMENADPPHLKVPTIIEPATQVITEDVTMTDVTDPAAELAKKKEAIRKALSTQERASGTTQQDVEETVGTMLNHLQNVIVPYTTADGVQRDLITDTFFFELRRYRKKKGDASFEKSGNDTLERSIVAYPGDGPRTIYEAISEGLDLERIEGGTQLYGAISQMPKVFFVHIQRTQSINAKNNNVVAVEETMYLDRFMDVDQDSDLMRLRQCAWHLQYQYKLLVATQPEAAGDLETPEPKSVPVIFLDDEAEATSDSVLANQPAAPLTLSAQPFEVQLPVQHGLESDPVSKPLSLDIEGLPNLKEIQAMGEKQIQATREAVDKLFLQHQTQKYGLHAVICHSGQMSAGHYWNWIHDKAAGRWLKFNDDKVTEVTDTAVVLAELNRAGEPYFLCYVRDDARDEIVEVPKRAPQPSDSQTDVVEITSDDMQDYTDIKSAATVEISVDNMSDGFIPIARHNSPVNGVNGTSPPTDKTPSA
jgi:ubiquitin carboxyl-terminal hydrolase 25/28